MSNREWMTGRRMSEEEINELRKRFKNYTNKTGETNPCYEIFLDDENKKTNTQTNKTWWTETKLWIVSSIFFITFLSLAYFYPMIALVICLISLGALFLYVLIWAGTILLKNILELDDN
jgi:hypothetical protein